ncbi:MAG: L,D-transpeptidase family protein, partial [Myxococcales bacterium]|nr:L,D-transpeptidase family protein [Myxococcales bacterium]
MRPVLVIVGLAVVLGCAAVLSARAPMLAPGTRVDRLVVDKSERSLVAYEGEREVARLRVAIGFGGEGPKRWEGDGRTPEGTYRIDRRHVSRDY